MVSAPPPAPVSGEAEERQRHRGDVEDRGGDDREEAERRQRGGGEDREEVEKTLRGTRTRR